MAGVKISQLPLVISAQTTDLFPVVQAGVTSGETLAQVQTLFGFSGGILGLAHGGTNAALTASVGGIVYSGASALAILSGTATANLPLLSGSSAAPTWGSFALSLGGALTTAGALTTSGAFGATFTFTNTTAVTFPTSGTLATTSQLPSLPLSLVNGGTNASLTASNGGIFYSTATAGAILSGTATANQLLLSGSSSAPAWSTSTYPATNAANTLLYASSANVMSALATANSSGLLTNGSGVPAWVTVTGTGAPVLATSPTLVTPVLGVASATSINFGGTALNTYVQGTFTPTLTGSSANPTSITYASQVGKYTQIGNVVYWSVFISVSALTIGAASGDLQISGLPVAAGAGVGLNAVGSIAAGAVTFTGQLSPFVAPNSSVVNVYVSATTLNLALLAITAISSSTVIAASGYYYTV